MSDPVQPAWRLERESKARAEAIARNMGISTSELVDLLITRLELTDQGIPEWWTPLARDEELPIASVA